MTRFASPSIAATSPGDVAALLGLLERQRALYIQLGELSGQQTLLVSQSQVEPLLTLLAQRQRIIDELSVVHGELEPYRRRWDPLLAELGTADRARVGGLVKEIQALLAGILEQDEKDRGSLQASHGRIADQTRKAARAAGAINAYQQPRAEARSGAAASHRTDREG